MFEYCNEPMLNLSEFVFILPLKQLSKVTRAVILGIGVCYYARLNDRRAYCKYIWRYFDNSCPLPGGGGRIRDEIVR